MANFQYVELIQSNSAPLMDKFLLMENVNVYQDLLRSIKLAVKFVWQTGILTRVDSAFVWMVFRETFKEFVFKLIYNVMDQTKCL